MRTQSVLARLRTGAIRAGAAASAKAAACPSWKNGPFTSYQRPAQLGELRGRNVAGPVYPLTGVTTPTFALLERRRSLQSPLS